MKAIPIFLIKALLKGCFFVIHFRILKRFLILNIALFASHLSRFASVNDEHAWSILPGNVWWLTPEFLCSMWGLGVFTSAFLVEEIASGLRAVSHGQREAALSQGFTPWQELRFILLPQGLANAWQPIVGQYLNLMKLSSLASGIGFAELTYQVRQIESYNAHALEAFAVGTALYLALGVAMGVALTRLGPGRKLQRSAQHER